MKTKKPMKQKGRAKRNMTKPGSSLLTNEAVNGRLEMLAP